MRIHAYGVSAALQLDEIPIPLPGSGQVLVRVKAAGVNEVDWRTCDGLLQGRSPIALPALLGSEVAGEVVSTGAGVVRFKPRDRVFGLSHRRGGFSDYLVLDEGDLAPIPGGLDDYRAAAIPIGGMTAWAALHLADEPWPGQRVLVHGATGSVGGIAIQIARDLGATVYATASGRTSAYVRGLGALPIVDHAKEPLEEKVRDIDLVIDAVGGEIVDRSWSLLAPGGAIVSIADIDIEARTPPDRRGYWCDTPESDVKLLSRIARIVAGGDLRVTLADVVDFATLPRAIERLRAGSDKPGKTVLDFADHGERRN